MRWAEARNTSGADDITRWRFAARSAAPLMTILLFAYLMVWADKSSPIPLPGQLVRIDGTVERMRIRQGDRCPYLEIRINTPRGWIKAGNGMLCRTIARLKPLPPGTPVTVLVEPREEENRIWELSSGGRVLLAYDEMRARRETQQRILPWVGSLIAAICLPLAGSIVVWLSMELSRLVRRLLGKAGAS